VPSEDFQDGFELQHVTFINPFNPKKSIDCFSRARANFSTNYRTITGYDCAIGPTKHRPIDQNWLRFEISLMFFSSAVPLGHSSIAVLVGEPYLVLSAERIRSCRTIVPIERSLHCA
jgi:hypothetical protein